jgi:1,4-dihydroxy-2-naphthoate octaprenyltransferase
MGSGLVLCKHECVSALRIWVAGARPRTLVAAVVPVAVGAVCGSLLSVQSLNLALVLLALVVSLALQVGVNYANDYSDGVRGTDKNRVGPLRIVASGLAKPAAVKRAAFAMFAVAALAGLVIAANTSWWLIVLGAASIAAAWFYTGGPRPYGYAGFGEIFVFMFFGLVATVGTTYAATSQFFGWVLLPGSAVGILAVQLLVVNNLRDIPTDMESGKRTLAVRMGDVRTRSLYAALTAMFFIIVIIMSFKFRGAALALLAIPTASKPLQLVRRGASGSELVKVLSATALTQLVAGALLIGGLLLSH